TRHRATRSSSTGRSEKWRQARWERTTSKNSLPAAIAPPNVAPSPRSIPGWFVSPVRGCLTGRPSARKGAVRSAVARKDVRVDLHRSDDQELFRETTRKFLESTCPVSTVREWAEKEP